MSRRQHHSDWQVKNALKKTIRSIAESGFAIILGRAGAQITRDITSSLHIFLTAPFEWRIKKVMEKYQLDEKVAVRKVKDMDANRKKLLETFSPKGQSPYCYDVVFNMKYLSKQVVISDIIHLMQLKKLI